MAEKLDRRVVRTRQLLQDALLDLILEQGYDAITVQDITDRANLSRATFYLHYRDKDDLLLTTLEAGYDDLVERVGFPPPAGQILTEPTPVRQIFEHAAERSRLYRVILSSGVGGTVLRRTRDYMAARSLAWMQQIGQKTEVPLKVVSAYMSGSLLNMVSWWLDSEVSYTAAEMEQMFLSLALGGVFFVLGIDPAILQNSDSPLRDALASLLPDREVD
jgi:AcrR family transcriptional regulator